MAADAADRRRTELGVGSDILLAQGPQRPMVQEIVLLPVHEAGHDLFDGMMAVSQG